MRLTIFSLEFCRWPREPHSLYLSLESLNLWGFRLENFNFWAQPMKPNPIGPYLDFPVENPPS